LSTISPIAPVPVIDLHVHSVYSDGSMTVEEILEVANRRGYLVGIADHASREDKIIHDAHLLSYLDALDKFPVYRSLELDVELGSDISASCLARLDYLIVGVHFLTLDGIQTFFWDPLAVISDAERFVEAYVSAATAAMGNMRMNIFAHPTLLPIALRGESNALWTRDRVRRLVRAAVENHVALEISGHWQVPGPVVIEEGLRQGATFSIGSDGHSPDSVCDLAYPLAIVRQFGIGPHQLYVPRRRLAALV